MKQQIQALTILIITVILQSCGQVSSEDVKPEIIRTKYSGTYYESTRSLEIEGWFTIGNGTTYVNLDHPSKFSVDGVKTTRDSDILGQVFYRYYKSNLNYNQLKTYNLVYTNSEEANFYNSLNIPSRVTFTTVNEVEDGQSLSVHYNVENSGDGADHIELKISDLPNKNDYAGNPSGVFTFTPEELAEVKGKSLTIVVCRKNFISQIEHPGDGGYIRVAYCSTSKNVLIK